MAYDSAFNANQQHFLVLILMSGKSNNLRKAENQTLENTRMVNLYAIHLRSKRCTLDP